MTFTAQVLARLQDAPEPMSVAALSDAFGRDRKAIRRALDLLQAKNRIRIAERVAVPTGSAIALYVADRSRYVERTDSAAQTLYAMQAVARTLTRLRPIDQYRSDK